MKRFIFLVILLSFGLVFATSSQILAQSSESNSQSGSSNFSLDFSSDLGGFYFQDASGFRIALNGVPYEGEVDDDVYILGSNDLLSVEIVGTQNIILRNIPINLSGDIVLPSIGVINIAGLTISRAQKKVEDRLAETFKNPSVSISIEIPRKVIVHISGSVPNPGKYVIPAQSRVDLAIIPSILEIPQSNSSTINWGSFATELLQFKQYSFRNIKIKHSDGTISYADLIDYFRTGDLESNPIIRNGDQIEIPRISSNTATISITGAVRFGYELEFKDGETISELLAIAEYFEENADSSAVNIFRKNENQVNKIVVNKSDWDSFDLQPNDRIIVPEEKINRPNSTVWISGEVNNPGNYPIVGGQTSLSDLINLSGGLTSNALPKASYLIRGEDLNNEIPNKFNSDLMSRTSDQFIQGIEYLKQETALTQNRVFINLDNPEESNSVTLFDGDRLYVPRDEQTIFIFGQVNNPGYFPFNEALNLSVSDFISRAGGFALSADKNRVFIIKAGSASWYKPGDTNLESGDRIFVDRNPVEDLNALRTYQIQKAQERNTRIQLIMTGITAITSVITAYVAVRNIR